MAELFESPGKSSWESNVIAVNGEASGMDTRPRLFSTLKIGFDVKSIIQMWENGPVPLLPQINKVPPNLMIIYLISVVGLCFELCEPFSSVRYRTSKKSSSFLIVNSHFFRLARLFNQQIPPLEKSCPKFSEKQGKTFIW